MQLYHQDQQLRRRYYQSSSYLFQYQGYHQRLEPMAYLAFHPGLAASPAFHQHHHPEPDHCHHQGFAQAATLRPYQPV